MPDISDPAAQSAFIHPTAVVDSRARLGAGVRIGPYCVIGPGVEIGDRTELKNGVVVDGNTSIGRDNLIYSYAVIGTAPQDLKYKGGDTRVVVGDSNVIREYVTINVGTEKGGGLTSVGSNNLLMTTCHVAHDCLVGDNCIISNGVLLAGHIIVGNSAVLSGAVAIHHFVTVGEFAFIGGLSRIVQDVPPFLVSEGNPAEARTVNVVGLARNGFAQQAIAALENAFRQVFRSGRPMSETLKRLKEGPDAAAEVLRLVEFLDSATPASMAAPGSRKGETVGVRTAVVGVGSMGASHARVLKSVPDCELVAVCDSDAARAGEVAAKYGVEAVADYRSLEGRVDAVSVAVPTSAHADVALFFLKRGVSVLVEKPMARTSEQARALVDAAAASGAALMVGHIERFNPAFMAIEDLGVKALFIECDRISPFKFRSADIGVVFDLMIHDIDLILHLAQSKVKSIAACGVPVIGIHEDICNARIVFENNCVANVTASRVSTKSLRKIRIFSPDSYVAIDTGARQALLYKKSPKLTIDMAKALMSGAKSLADFAGLSFPDLLEIKELQLDSHEPLAKELEAFISAVRDGVEPPVTGREGLEAIEVAEAVVREVRSHKWNI